MPKLEDLGLKGRLLAEIHGEEYELANVRAVRGMMKKPLYHFYPTDTEDVASAVKWAVANNVKLTVKGGGQNPAGASTIEQGLLIDLRDINHVVLEEDMSCRVGGGCIWDQVYKELHKNGRVAVGGGVWVVGVGGFLSNGGYSWFSSLYGMGIDQILEATVVLANGQIVRCSSANESDLFWAIRGGASQFGIITEFRLKTYKEEGEMFVGVMIYKAPDLPLLSKALQSWLKKRTDRESLVFGIIKAPEGHQALMINPWALGDRSHQEQIFKPFLEDIKPVFTHNYYAPSMVEVGHAVDAILLGDHPPRLMSASATYSQLWPGMLEDCQQAHQAFLEKHKHHKDTMLLFESHAVKRPDPSATSYPCDIQNHSYVVVTTSYDDVKEDDLAAAFVYSITDIVRKYEVTNTGRDLGLLGNACMYKADPKEIYSQNYSRLQRLKAKYDPSSVFHLFPYIEPNANA